jgi:CENP-B N-terminal DNA-binding domain
MGRHHDIARALDADRAWRLAEFERDRFARASTKDAARAVPRAQEMGRPFKLTHHQKREGIKRREQGETLADIGRSFNVIPATISRLTT